MFTISAWARNATWKRINLNCDGPKDKGPENLGLTVIHGSARVVCLQCVSVIDEECLFASGWPPSLPEVPP